LGLQGSKSTANPNQLVFQGTSLHPSGSGFALKTVPKPPSPMVLSIPQAFGSDGDQQLFDVITVTSPNVDII